MADKHTIITDKYLVKPGTKVSLKDYDTEYNDDVFFKGNILEKADGQKILDEEKEKLAVMQEKLYAYNQYSVLIIFQAMDAAGKDGAVKHIMSGINPAGVKVHSFKTPSSNELEHDYFWRHYIALPPRGEVGIFNRSHYENVLITRVHPEYIMNEHLPGINNIKDINDEFWQKRFKQIKRFEKNISQNGTIVLKFFLHISKKEQKKRFIERIDNPKKNWKISPADSKERNFWKDYQFAYEEAIRNTSTEYAPWFIIPADDKWFTRLAIGVIIQKQFEKLNLEYPKVSDKTLAELKVIREQLMNES
ncbi:MAG: polyphosphate kinase 2 family protein [Ignavibacteria bacterium]|nr:polyphosphate kinase 2 family protein [Ignavibacteria bacterium]